MTDHDELLIQTLRIVVSSWRGPVPSFVPSDLREHLTVWTENDFARANIDTEALQLLANCGVLAKLDHGGTIYYLMKRESVWRKAVSDAYRKVDTDFVMHRDRVEMSMRAFPYLLYFADGKQVTSGRQLHNLVCQHLDIPHIAVFVTPAVCSLFLRCWKMSLPSICSQIVNQERKTALLFVLLSCCVMGLWALMILGDPDKAMHTAIHDFL